MNLARVKTTAVSWLFANFKYSIVMSFWVWEKIFFCDLAQNRLGKNGQIKVKIVIEKMTNWLIHTYPIFNPWWHLFKLNFCFKLDIGHHSKFSRLRSKILSWIYPQLTWSKLPLINELIWRSCVCTCVPACAPTLETVLTDPQQVFFFRSTSDLTETRISILRLSH